MAIIGTDITEAAKLLKQGNLVGIPTETVYGLAANAFDAIAVAKIFEVKKRPSFDPLIVHIRSQDYLEKVASEITPTAELLARNFWPGPLTLVLPKTAQVPELVTSGLPSVAVRVPDHPMTLALLSMLQFPLASPSANPFGYISPTRASHVQAQLGNSIPYILDGGDCSVGIESTVVGFENDDPVIYRPGGISEELIMEVTGKPIVKKPEDQLPVAPGMMKSHYAPAKKLIVGQIPQLIKTYGSKHAAVLCFNQTYPGIAEERQMQLSPRGDLAEAAKNLFGALRKLDAMNINYIFAELVPMHGLGIAINDRLQKAAS